MTAVIPAAGHGTRFLPVTRVVPKEMLPIGSRPALELIVEEARAAGADDIVIVVSPGKDLIRTYFSGAPGVRFVSQTEQRGLGHAVLMAKDAIPSDADRVLILLGDALVAGGCAAKEMVAASDARGGAAVIGCERVPREKISRYGIMKPASDEKVERGGCFRISDIVEKPTVEEAPSDVAVAARYLLPRTIFDLLATQSPGRKGEIELTDAIRRLLEVTQAYGYVYPGRRQDIGNPKGYFEALKAMGENE